MRRYDNTKYKRIISVAITLIMLILLIICDNELQNERSKMKNKYMDNSLNATFVAKSDYKFKLDVQPEGKKQSDTTKKRSLKNIENSFINIDEQLSIVSCYYADLCIMRCSGGTLEDTLVKINSMTLEESKCQSKYLGLELTSTKFIDETIAHGWLQNITNIGIDSLKLISMDLESIKKSSFSGRPFGTSSNPLVLSFKNTMVKTLEKSMFSKSSITTFEVYFDEILTGINIEESVFDETIELVERIVLNNCLTNVEAVKNLTGKGNVLAGLKTLDLSYNFLEKLESGSFMKAPYLQQLFLMSSGIAEIESGTFDGLTDLIQLFLSNNKLKRLPDAIFVDFVSLKALYVSGNPWNCDCEMEWFKEYTSRMSYLEHRKCRVGSEWIDMDSFDFCPVNTSTSIPSSSTPAFIETTTTSTTKLATTVIPKNNEFIYEQIKCRNLLMYSYDDDESSIVWYKAIFKRRNINYTFSELGYTGSFLVDLETRLETKDYFIWRNARNISEYGCIFNITKTFMLKLNFGGTYTLCLCSNDTLDRYSLIADDCTAIVTPPDWEHRPWLLNKEKTTSIAIVVITFVTTILVTIFTVYYLVKYKPELIKGSKRVLIVKSGSYSPNVWVMPPKKHRHLSLFSDNGGYLTPKFERWIKKSNMRYQELQTITDKTNNVKETYDELNDQTLYEPPPLPPNHPTKRKDSCSPYIYSNM